MTFGVVVVVLLSLTAYCLIILLRIADVEFNLQERLSKIHALLLENQKRLDLLESPQRQLETKLSQPPRL